VNGNGKFFKWVAGGLALLVLVLIQVGLGDIRTDIQARQEDSVKNRDAVIHNSARIDSLSMQLNRHYDRHETDQAKMTLQVAAIAKALNVPVVVDTTRARKDSLP